MFFEKAKNGYSITACYARRFNDFSMSPHFHESAEMMYVEQGSCMISVNDQVWHLHEKEFLFIDSFVPHQLMVEETCFMFNLEISSRNKEFSFKELTSLYDFSQLDAMFCPQFYGKETRHLGGALKEYIEVRMESFSSFNQNNPQLEHFSYLLLSRFWMELFFVGRNQKQLMEIPYLKIAKRYIEEHLTETLRLPEVAAITGVDKSYLQYLLKVYEKQSFSGFVNQRRLEKASFLLLTTTQSVTDIAFFVGYNSRQYFSQVFETYYELSPKKYRQQHGAVKKDKHA